MFHTNDTQQTNTKDKENIFNLTLQYLKKYSSTVPAGIQGLALRRERRWRCTAEGTSAV